MKSALIRLISFVSEILNAEVPGRAATRGERNARYVLCRGMVPERQISCQLRASTSDLLGWQNAVPHAVAEQWSRRRRMLRSTPMLRTLTTIVLALAWPLPAMALSADTKIGMLSCTLSEPRDALTPDGASAERARDAICAFSSESGEHETYTGKITGVSITPQGQSTLIWVVRSPSEGPVRPGALQRTVAKTLDRFDPAS
jgi:hypothetical protein